MKRPVGRLGGLAVGTAVLLLTAQPLNRLTAQTDARLVEALRLAQSGQVDSGRAIVRRLLAALPPADSSYPQALLAAAKIAPNAVTVASYLNRIVVEYGAGPWADDALLLLTQLYFAQHDPAQTVQAAERLNRDYPDSPLRARANFSAARAYFELKNETRGCELIQQALVQRMPERRVRVVLAVKVERDSVAVVVDLAHRIFDVLDSTSGNGIVEDRARIIAVVTKRRLEETAERSPCRRDCAQLVVEDAAPKQGDADAHVLEACARQGAKSVRRDRHVIHALDERHDAIGDQCRLTPDEQRCVDMARALSVDEGLESCQVRLVLRRPVSDPPAVLAQLGAGPT